MAKKCPQQITIPSYLAIGAECHRKGSTVLRHGVIVSQTNSIVKAEPPQSTKSIIII